MNNQNTKFVHVNYLYIENYKIKYVYKKNFLFTLNQTGKYLKILSIPSNDFSKDSIIMCKNKISKLTGYGWLW